MRRRETEKQKRKTTNKDEIEKSLKAPTGCGSAWLERLIWDQEVAGSNPVTPTMYDLHQNKTLFFEYESVAQLDRATAF